MGLRADGLQVHMIIAAWAWGSYLGAEGVEGGNLYVHIRMLGEGAKVGQFLLVLGIDPSTVINDHRGVGEFLTHGTEAGDVLGIDQRTHRNALLGAGAPHPGPAGASTSSAIAPSLACAPPPFLPRSHP